jgi:2'-5' RNA ligase
MRLFTGIALPPDILENLNRLLEHLRPTAHVNWSAAYNLHITIKFIGSWKEDRLDELIGVLRALPAPGGMEIRISGLGWFPNPHSPRVLWAGVQAPEPLRILAETTDAALAELGVRKETKPFAPHLTLARIKEPFPLIKLKQAIAALASVDFGSFYTDCFYLYRSEQGPAGSIYTKLAEIPLEP